jgi:hypothetical protein
MAVLVVKSFPTNELVPVPMEIGDFEFPRASFKHFCETAIVEESPVESEIPVNFQIVFSELSFLKLISPSLLNSKHPTPLSPPQI